jgi:hypothetical protein
MWGRYNGGDGPSRMVKQPTGSGGEPSSPNCRVSAGVKARHPSSCKLLAINDLQRNGHGDWRFCVTFCVTFLALSPCQNLLDSSNATVTSTCVSSFPRTSDICLMVAPALFKALTPVIGDRLFSRQRYCGLRYFRSCLVKVMQHRS